MNKQQKQELLKLFPLHVEITQQILDNASLLDIELCIGAMALRKTLPSEFSNEISWGNSIGRVGSIYIHALDNDGWPVYLMELDEPITVKMSIRNVNN